MQPAHDVHLHVSPERVHKGHLLKQPSLNREERLGFGMKFAGAVVRPILVLEEH